ncbi:Protein indeterminate-domain 7 [Linum grandiflorum]
MSSIKGGIFGVDDEQQLLLASQQQQEEEVATHLHHPHHLITSIANSTTNSNASITTTHPPPLLVKKKRNLPGNPDPKAEVISLSPKTLMAKNRFVCEICTKGFQRDQNLQLHRRGHNLPWKLKQRNNNEVIRKKVYVCPEPGCVHNNPTRALGDLTGIKKHFSRKHGEKKWKCEKCSKKYAVQSDWKAHSKSCGTKEYKCDCGTMFSRRDSFITHRAFCDALAEETKSISNPSSAAAGIIMNHSTTSQSVINQITNPTIPDHQFNPTPPDTTSQPNHFISLPPPPPPTTTSTATSSSLLHLTTPLFSTSPSMSATALLQKAAQMGSTSSSSPPTAAMQLFMQGGGGGDPYSNEGHHQLLFANQLFHEGFMNGNYFPCSPGFVNGGGGGGSNNNGENAAAALWKSFGGVDHDGMTTTVDFLGINNGETTSSSRVTRNMDVVVTRFDEPSLN